ncbi:OmpA-OmpF porin, OOP family [Duganella sp. CF402]|uniref:outer membrane beta-barrel protein n=1 Tax=unclassified Duganella TaxID=2636909 RepID=UPI0008BD6A7E|nr:MULTISPECIES: outer membrane beta-barrel protein [unclassified Duganella]RZT05703.1 OOP family OmpA-OmpF porin [Duganella sp. BK701]SEM94219.1 OmpA-OmpF porin, OOP family [Duganella sp. CF402]
MKKILFALVASAAALGGTSAYAQSNTQDAAGTAYIGAGVVGSRYDFDTAGAGAVSGDNHSGTKAAGKIYGGYNIDQTWAVEAGYTDFGKRSYNYTQGGAAGGLNTDAHSYYVAGKGTWPVARDFAVFGKLGVARNHNEVTTSGIASVSGSDNKTALYASVGGEYAINKNVKVSLEYENYGKNDIDTGRKAGAITAGLRYNF